MGKSNYMDYSESNNWNVAKGYSEMKILKLMLESDEYETVAEFGTSNLIDEFMIDDNMKNEARLKAMKRLLKTLQMIINNTLFALKKKDKPVLESFADDLIKIEKVVKLVSRHSYNQRDKKKHLVIDEDKFDVILEMLINIKRDINEPLNNADLIFSSSEELDPDELKRKIMEDIVFSG